MYMSLHVKYTLFCQILIKLNFLDILRSNPQVSNFMKIRPVGTEFYADRQTDRTKLIVAFRSVASAPKK
jgi:hypothetical protein